MAVEQKHKYYFELFYHLGIDRTIMKLVRMQMPRMFPELAPDSREYKTRLNSLYTKVSRWADKEGWAEEVEKRTKDNKRQSDVLVRDEEQTLTATVALYRRMVSYILQKFGEGVLADQFRIKSLKEAKMMMELHMYLTELLHGRPSSVGPKVYELMDADERRGVDSVFEWLRKQVRKEPLLESLKDIVEAEERARAIDVIPVRELPAPKPVTEEPVPASEERVPAFLRSLSIARVEDIEALEKGEAQ